MITNGASDHYFLAGFPGTSQHDNRIWEATDLFKNPDFYVAVGQYLLGDSAFSNGHTMVAPYEKPHGGSSVYLS
jgi:hypothetical protein